MKLAVRKDTSGTVPMGGYYYMLHPFEMESVFQEKTFKQMGHLIIEVDDKEGARLLKEAAAALNHQIEVAILTEKQNAHNQGSKA